MTSLGKFSSNIRFSRFTEVPVARGRFTGKANATAIVAVGRTEIEIVTVEDTGTYKIKDLLLFYLSYTKYGIAVLNKIFAVRLNYLTHFKSDNFYASCELSTRKPPIFVITLSSLLFVIDCNIRF